MAGYLSPVHGRLQEKIDATVSYRKIEAFPLLVSLLQAARALGIPQRVGGGSRG
jgi:hypothetical protein